MPSEPELVGLLHRADWTRLRLAAELADGSSLLLAPGRRYRRQVGERVWGCDGQHPWEPPEEDPGGGEVHWISGPEPPLRALLCPQWLLPGTRLDVLGPVTACGRAAWHVAVTRRPDARFALSWAARGADRAEVFVDAELGILLRLAWDAEPVPDDGWADDEAEDDDAELIEGPQVTELVSLDLDPVIEPGRFAAPPGSRSGESFGPALFGDGLGGRAVKTAGGLAAGGLAAWLRLSSATAAAPRGGTAGTGEDAPAEPPAEAEIPADDPAPELSADGRPVGPPVPDEVLHLLQASAAADFTATAHEWYDAAAMLSRVPAGARRAGFGGLGSLIGVLTERPVILHRTAALRIGGPGQYQLDWSAELSRETAAGEPGGTREREPATIACDGQQCWRGYDDHVAVGPAAALAPELAQLTDASWLLEGLLAGGQLVTAGGRPAYRLQVARGDGDWATTLSASLALAFSAAAVAVVDAELGILVRLTSYDDGKPVRRYDLMGVTAAPGEFRVDLPADRTVADEEPWSSGGGGRGAQPGRNLLADAAGLIGRQVARDAAGAARSILRRLGGR